MIEIPFVHKIEFKCTFCGKVLQSDTIDKHEDTFHVNVKPCECTNENTNIINRIWFDINDYSKKNHKLPKYICLGYTERMDLKDCPNQSIMTEIYQSNSIFGIQIMEKSEKTWYEIR